MSPNARVDFLLIRQLQEVIATHVESFIVFVVLTENLCYLDMLPHQLEMMIPLLPQVMSLRVQQRKMQKLFLCVGTVTKLFFKRTVCLVQHD